MVLLTVFWAVDTALDAFLFALSAALFALDAVWLALSAALFAAFAVSSVTLQPSEFHHIKYSSRHYFQRIFLYEHVIFDSHSCW